MAQQPKDEFERLSQLDPATGIEFDSTAVWQKVEDQLAEPTPALSLVASPADATASTEVSQTLATRRTNRVAWLQIAASVAATAVVSTMVVTGVMHRGNAQSGLQSNAAEIGRQDALDSAQSSSLAEGPLANTAQSGSGSETAPGLPGIPSQGSADSAAVEAMPYPGGSVREVFVGKDLSSAQGNASAFGFDDSAIMTASTMTRLQEAFGVKGRVERSGDGFTINTQNVWLGLNGNGTGAFWFGRSWEQLEPKKQDQDAAEAKARSIMSTLGLDPAEFTIVTESFEYGVWAATDAPDTPVTSDGAASSDTAVSPDNAGSSPAYSGSNDGPNAGSNEADGTGIEPAPLPGPQHSITLTRVTATPARFSGRHTAGEWSFEFNGTEVLNAQGSLARIIELGDYPVVSARDAVDRMNDPRFGVSAVISDDTSASSIIEPYGLGYGEPGVSGAGSAARHSATPGEKLTWPVTTHVVSGGSLKNAGFYLADGSNVVLPVWEFAGENGLHYQVLAVADSALRF